MKFIMLNTYLKLKGFATTGGQAKQLIKDGFVTLNSEVETRNKKKLYAGDVLLIDGQKFIVKDEEIKD